MATGTVTWVGASENHGFITPDEGGKDLFVDPTNISGDSRQLVVGTSVQFENRGAARGRVVAANVVLKTAGADDRQEASPVLVSEQGSSRIGLEREPVKPLDAPGPFDVRLSLWATLSRAAAPPATTRDANRRGLAIEPAAEAKVESAVQEPNFDRLAE
jgi:CspA family cold shock protein